MNLDVKPVSTRNMIIIIVVLINAVLIEEAYTNGIAYGWLLLSLPLLLLTVYDAVEKRNSPVRKHPLIRNLLKGRRRKENLSLEADNTGNALTTKQDSIAYSKGKTISR